jgi:hypothetical protein
MRTATSNINFWDLVKQTTKIDFEQFLNELSFNDDSIDAATYKFFDKPMLFNQFLSIEDAFKFVEDFAVDDSDFRQDTAKRILARLTSNGDFSYQGLQDAINKRPPTADTLEDVINSLKTNLKEVINLGGNFKKDRLIVTDDERGIFDFSLASNGLFRPVEFYSDSYVRSKEPNEFAYTRMPEGVIPPDRVFKDVVGANRVFYFVSKDNKKYTCERRQKGTTDVFNNLSNFCFLGQNEQGITLPLDVKNPKKVYNGIVPHRLKYASKAKKVYLQFERQEDSSKYVDIFIPINLIVGSNSAVKTMNTLMPVMVASALEEFDIKARISLFRNGKRKNSLPFQTVSVVVKDYHESVDERLSALINLSSNSRFQENFFGALLIAQGDEGLQKDENGNPIFASTSDTLMSKLMYYNQDAMVNLFMRYKNWVNANVGQPFVNTKVVNQNFQFLTTAHVGEKSPEFYSQESISPQVIANQLPYLMYEFYWHMDFLAIEFVPIPKLIDTLFKRFEEDDFFKQIYERPNRADISRIIRQYLSNLLIYKYYSSNSGSFADSAEETTRKNDKKEELTSEINQALKNYSK